MGAESDEQLRREHEARQKRDTKRALNQAGKALNQPSNTGGTSGNKKGGGCIVTLLISLATLGLLSFSLLA